MMKKLLITIVFLIALAFPILADDWKIDGQRYALVAEQMIQKPTEYTPDQIATMIVNLQIYLEQLIEELNSRI